MRVDSLPLGDTELDGADRLRAFVADMAFPCVGAKSALARGGLVIHRARDLTSAWDDLQIYAALMAFVARYRTDPAPFQSLAIVFEGPGTLDEAAFETALWQRAQSLSDKDFWLGQTPDPRASLDPEDPDFALSFGGEAFFLVGLHPAASRPARRFERPTIVFNPHAQFRNLRETGRYEPMRRTILKRDLALAGTENPMLARFGEVSEARQYSGRAVDAHWRCPFQSRAILPDET